MPDLIYAASAAGFFGLSMLLIHLLDRLRDGRNP